MHTHYYYVSRIVSTSQDYLFYIKREILHMNKIHVTYKNLLLPITFIAATLISACDNDKDAMAEAEKIKRNTCKKSSKKSTSNQCSFTTKPKCKKLLPISTQKVEPILRLLKSVSSRAGIHSFDKALTPLLK